MADNRELRVIVPEGLQEPKAFNSWHIFPRDAECFVLDFGESHVSDTIALVSSNLLSASQYKDFVMSLLAAGLAYEGAYSEDLGLDLPKRRNEHTSTPADKED